MRTLITLLALTALTTTAHAGDPPAAAERTSPVPPPPSESEDGALSWDDAAPKLVCEEQERFWSGSCHGELRATVRAKRRMKPLRVSMRQLGFTSEGVLYELGPTEVAAGDAWQTPPLRVQKASRWLLVLTYEDEAGRERQLSATVDVTNPAREAAEAQCKVCSGSFGPWGIQQREWCNCATRDAGKRCDDERGCEGACLVNKNRKTPRDAAGVCAPRKVIFGCHTKLIHDPKHPAGRVTTRICAD
jgi:hypothetical protein